MIAESVIYPELVATPAILDVPIQERGAMKPGFFNANYLESIKNISKCAAITLACGGAGLASGVIISEHMTNLTQVSRFASDINCLFYGVTTGITTVIGLGLGVVTARHEK